MADVINSLNAQFERLLTHLVAGCARQYGERLVSVAVFGSVGRGTQRPDSDIDLLIVAEGLPDGRLARAAEFRTIERGLAPHLERARADGLTTELSPVFKTPGEAEQASPLMLDMIEDARLLYDRDDFMKQTLQRLAARLARLNARRIWRGDAWHWDLKPNFQPGEVFGI